MSNAKPLYATRTFKDEGTTRTFGRGELVKDCTEGELLNYRAAGLVAEERTDAATEFMKDDEPKSEKPKANVKPAA